MEVKEFNKRIDEAIDFVRRDEWGGYSCNAIGHAFSKEDHCTDHHGNKIEIIYSKVMAQNERYLFVSDIHGYVPNNHLARQVRRQDFIENFRQYCLSIELYKRF